MRPLTFDDLLAIDRIEAPAVSPDGSTVAYTVARHDAAANTVSRSIWLLDIATARTRELTPGPGNHSGPVWSPDGAFLAFVSDRDADAGSQLWLLPLAGGEARRVTSGHGGVSQVTWSPDGTRIAFARQVVVSPHLTGEEAGDVDPSTADGRARIHGLCNARSTARIADGLLFRHWDQWRDRRRNHVFLLDVASGQLSDLTPGDRDAPPLALGSSRDIDFSPDGRALAFVSNPDEEVARSTNNCVFVQSIDGIHADGAVRLVSTSRACDNHPRFLPDGRLAYLAMERPGYEADRQRLVIADLASGQTTTLLQDFDRSPHAFAVCDSGAAVAMLAQDRGRTSVYRLDIATGAVRQLTCGTTNTALAPVPGSEDLVVARQSTTEPADLFLLTPGAGIEPFLDDGPVPDRVPADAGAAVRRLTTSRDVLADVTMNPVEELWYSGAEDTPLHGFLIRPPDFREDRRYPLVLLIHGGPQGAFADEFHARWNAQMFAARGAVVAFPNPRGSTGYGQALTDQISRDWGGRCYEDIMLFVDALLERYPFIDPGRLTAAGASYGGFMINWILGHTDRFAALVCHDGVFVSETMAYTTEELWFEDHEHGGMPHEPDTDHERFSPHRHAASFRTPTLVVHGEQDFRCPISEGLGLFTALQVNGVPSRLLTFPDEGHWVTRPANAQVWYNEVVGWLMRWVSDGG